MKYLYFYLIVINVFGFVIMGMDKSKAKRHKWRISENTFFITAILGGSLGVYGAMQQFRHKTQHSKFVYGIPAILIVQLIAAFYIYFKFFMQ